MKKINESDVSLKGDLFWAVTNLIQMEEHLAHTYFLTKKEKYLDIYNEIRKIRARKIHELVPKDREGDLWCINKHLISTIMRLTEIGIKFKYEGDDKKAKEYFDDASDLYDLFIMGMVK